MNLKKSFCITLGLLVGLSLVGCGNEPAPKDATPKAEVTKPAAATTNTAAPAVASETKK
ncbi:MAG: hypothetical protein HQM08_13950 [Candidatus Riflebacteria bacterium]|nr:hypothetical protein [Candidatus Riflebacteria bacterium]